jgi:hypothetical protein
MQTITYLCHMSRMRIVPLASCIPQFAFIACTISVRIEMIIWVLAREWLAAKVTRVYSTTGILTLRIDEDK